MKPTDAKKGVELAEEMTRLIDESGAAEPIKNKVVAVMSDTCRAQVLANKLWTAKMSQEQQRTISTLPCYMHTVGPR